MQFDDEGLFWTPFQYQSQRKPAAEKSAPRPKVLPPIPDTGWVPRAHFPDLSAAKTISLDTETCDPDLLEKGPGCRRGAYIVGVSVATNDGFKGYYPVAHSMGDNLEKENVYAWLRDQLGRSNQPKVGANILYDLDFLEEEGIKVAGPCYDVLYADPIIYEYSNSYSLDSVAERRLGQKKETSLLYQWCADAYGGKADSDQRANIWRSPVSLVGPYAEQDALLPLELIKVQVPMLRAMGAAQTFEMECKLIPLLLKLRRRGVPIDLAYCQQLDDELSSKIEVMQADLGIDVNDKDQILALCDANEIPYPTTELGNPSFTKDWLQEQDHPKLRGIVDLRKLYKMRDTFVRGSLLGSHINGVVHCSFHPLRTDGYGTVSGRFSSSNPNLQQIPARDEYWGPRIRAAFVAHYWENRDRIWCKNDMSQIEFRLGVHYGVGENAAAVRTEYNQDAKTDFYMVASRYTGLPRQEAKSLSLGSLYGMGKPKFVRMTKKPPAIYDQFHQRLPFMKETYNYYADEARDNGFVTTIGGRVCHLDPGYEHKALNRKLQGSCADWIKRSMLLAEQAGIFDELDLYLTVHDELDTAMRPTAASIEAQRELHRIMCIAYTLNVPVLVGSDIGLSWGRLEDMEPASLTVTDLEKVLNEST